jgi:hypothetical protein
MRIRPLMVAIVFAGCVSTTATPPAPWTKPRLSAAPPPYAAAWEKAENRATCALLAPAALGMHGEAKPRIATFSGGWAVAYDLPGTRSAFGVAGTGASATGSAYSGWPNKRTWSDGSSAEYGPEGGTGPNQLAYLRIPGQDCLYNVWSRVSREHLEQLLDQLRFVEVR